MAAEIGQRGRLDLALAVSAGATRATRARAEPPLQLSRTRYDQPLRPDWAHLTLLHLAGVLDGDRYDLNVALGPQACATLSSAGATLVHRMPHTDAQQTLSITLAEQSRLCWLPEPLILFGGARYSQRTQITLGDGALLVLLDIIVMGRLARGEAFAFDHFESRLDVADPHGRLLLAERTWLEPAADDPTALGMFGRAQVLGSLYILGGGLDTAAICASVMTDASRAIGATPLPNDCGVLIRQLGRTPSLVSANLRRIWQSTAALLPQLTG